MNLSKQTKEIVDQASRTLSRLYTLGLTPLQIMILMGVRHMEWEATAGDSSAVSQSPNLPKLFTNSAYHAVKAKYEEHSRTPPSRQGFWNAVKGLQRERFLYVAPHKKNTSKRSISLTAIGDALFEYPRSIQLY